MGCCPGVCHHVKRFKEELQIVKSWLKYRMKKGGGKKSSPLDNIPPEHWTKAMTKEVLELLWVLEWTLSKYPELDIWFDKVLEGELFSADEIPLPTAAECKQPKIKPQTKEKITIRPLRRPNLKPVTLLKRASKKERTSK